MALPKEIAPLFKNYDTTVMDLQQSAELIVLTVLTRGTLEQIALLFELYRTDRIQMIFRKDYEGLRTLPAPTVSLWGLIFLSEEERKEYFMWRQSPKQRWAPRRIPGANS